MKSGKWHFQEWLKAYLAQAKQDGRAVRLLELGCGRAESVAEVLALFPTTEYVGIEPDPRSVVSAKTNTKPFDHATILPGLAYGKVPHKALQKPFDLVFSLSVLEHVKDLPSFLAYAANMAKPGADVIHLYDLGHALGPKTWKEWVQTRLCNSPLLRFIPEAKVARYLATEDVQQTLERCGCQVKNLTFHGMPSHVALLKAVQEPGSLVKDVHEAEQRWSTQVTNLKEKERLFRTIGFWTKKQTSSQ